MFTCIGLHALDDVALAVHGGAAGFDVDGGGFLVLKGGKAVEGDDVFADAAGLLNTQFKRYVFSSYLCKIFFG